MRVKQEILQLKLPVASGYYEFEVKEGDGLSVIGENGSGKSELLQRIYKKGKNVAYRGNRASLSKDEKALFDVEVDYYDGSLRNVIDEKIIDLVERAGAKYDILPINVSNAFGIEEKDFFLKVKSVKGELEPFIALLYALSKDSKLLIFDDVFGLDGEVKKRITPYLEKAREEFGLTYLIASTDFEFCKKLTNFTVLIEEDKVVEYAKSDVISKKPLHPYSKWFMGKKGKDSVVFIRTEKDEKPSKKACKFSVICPYSDEVCKSKQCEFSLYGKDHLTACHKI